MPQVQNTQISGLYVQSPMPDFAGSESGAIALPLQHTAVQARVTGNLARVEVTQQFTNPFTTTLEAVYIFPLPDEAAVDSMTIRIGDRTIRGSIKKRQEAQEIYQKAKAQGQTAGLLEQERDNVFTQSLANIRPGEQIDVIISYTDSLKFVGGDYEFIFPMVVGPRYIPGLPIEGGMTGSATAPMMQNADTDLVPDASRLNAPILPAGMRSGHDISVTLEIEAGLGVQKIQSPSHQIQVEREEALVRVMLAAGDTVPNKDLILRYQVSGATTQMTVLSQSDERGGHFALYLIPAVQYRPEQVVAKDVVFLIDTSGSQMGAPLMQCQALMRRMIDGLNQDDTFSIMDFSDTTQQLSPVPLANTPQNRAAALNYIKKLTANGGTQMLQGIQTILNFPVTDASRLRTIVLLTDGYIGNENQILDAVQKQLKPGNRLHSFGAGSSVNRFLLNRIAEIGRGTASIIRQDEAVDTVVDRFFRQINNPVLTNLQVSWEGAGSSPLWHPTLLPDLFAEQPLVLFGHKPDGQSGTLHIHGTAAGGDRYHQAFSVHFAPTGNPAIAQLWGRSHLKHLSNQMLGGDTKTGVEAMTKTALTYQLLSQYTAFVAVSDEVRVDNTQPSVSVQVPVEMPDGVDYQGVFGVASMAAPGLMLRRSSAFASSARARRSQPAPTLQAPPAPASAMSPDVPELYCNVFDVEESISFSEEARGSQSKPINTPSRHFPGALRQSGFPGSSRSQSDPSDSITSIEVVSAIGLEPSAIALLFQHLQQLQISSGITGELVFEFALNKGRVRQLIWDEQASSLQDESIVKMVQRSLNAWKPDKAIATSVRLVLRIQS